MRSHNKGRKGSDAIQRRRMRIEGVYVRLTVVDEHIDASSLVSQGVDEIDDVLVLRHVKIVGLCHPALGSDLRNRLLSSRLYVSSRLKKISCNMELGDRAWKCGMISPGSYR